MSLNNIWFYNFYIIYLDWWYNYEKVRLSNISKLTLLSDVTDYEIYQKTCKRP